MQHVRTSDREQAWAKSWRERGLDTSVTLTWKDAPEEGKWRPQSVHAARCYVTKFLSQIKFHGDYVAYVEGGRFDYHVHLLYAEADMPRRKLDSHWRTQAGIADVRPAYEARPCIKCEARRSCPDYTRSGLPCIDSYTYIARKFDDDGRLCDRIFGRADGRHLS